MSQEPEKEGGEKRKAAPPPNSDEGLEVREKSNHPAVGCSLMDSINPQPREDRLICG